MAAAVEKEEKQLPIYRHSGLENGTCNLTDTFDTSTRIMVMSGHA